MMTKNVLIAIVGLVSLLAVAVIDANVVNIVNDIVVPKNDKRQYRGLELGNGLKAIVVSDPTTDKAAASLRVSVGSMSDPWETQGMAHFCEHMLFLGTKKYPNETDYSKFIQSHGGDMNAGTGLEDTTYFFTIAPEYLDGALDRFSQFFIAPLFTASAVEREVNAVNSEYSLNLNRDNRKIFMVKQTLAKPGHDFGKFSVGSKETLLEAPKSRGVDPRDEVMKFYTKWYSANIMTLAVLGKQSLDELTKWVDSKFSPIENKNVTITKWDNPYGSSEVNRMIKIETIKEKNELQLNFPIGDLRPYYRTKIGRYVSYILGDEGPGSLAAYLKSKGWAEYVAGGMDSVSNGFGLGEISMTLTDEGQKHINDITEACTQYLKMVQDSGPQERIFKEAAAIGKIEFENKEKEDPSSLVGYLSEGLSRHNFSEVIKAFYVMTEYKPEVIDKFLKAMKPENMMSFVTAHKFDKTLDKHEKWFNTDFSVEPYDPKFVQKLSKLSSNPEFKLPTPNEFITTDTNLKPRDPSMGEVPELVLHNSMMDVWYHQDKKFLIPKTSINVKLTSPFGNVDPFHQTLLGLLTSLIEDSLLIDLFAASKAGLGYSISDTKAGLSLSVNGYPEKLGTLLMKVLDRLLNFKADPNRFPVLKELFTRNLRNFNVSSPLGQAGSYFGELLQSGEWTVQQLQKDLNEVTISNMEKFVPTLLSQLHIDVLGSGNIVREEILSIAKKFQSTLVSKMNTKPYQVSALEKDRAVQLFEGENCAFVRNHPSEKDSAVMSYMQANATTMLNSLVVGLLEQIASQPAYDDLRTKQQLGYVVYTAPVVMRGIVGFLVGLQSARLPQYVESRIDNFLIEFRKILSEMSDKEFEEQKKGYATKRFEEIKQLSTQTMVWWGEIASGQNNFMRRELEKPILERDVTKSKLLEFYDAYINPKTTSRSRLHVWVAGTEARAAGFKIEDVCSNSTMPSCISGQLEYRNEHPLYPNVKPYKSIEEFVATCPRNCVEA